MDQPPPPAAPEPDAAGSSPRDSARAAARKLRPYAVLALLAVTLLVTYLANLAILPYAHGIVTRMNTDPGLTVADDLLYGSLLWVVWASLSLLGLAGLRRLLKHLSGRAWSRAMRRFPPLVAAALATAPAALTVIMGVAMSTNALALMVVAGTWALVVYFATRRPSDPFATAGL